MDPQYDVINGPDMVAKSKITVRSAVTTPPTLVHANFEILRNKRYVESPNLVHMIPKYHKSAVGI